MSTNRYEGLLSENLTSEQLVRQALQLLESDFRELALLALADWSRLEMVSQDLFQAVASLQRPSWGMWNGLLTALKNARNNLLRTAGDKDRERIEQATFLRCVLQQFEIRLDSELVQSLKPLGELTRSSVPKKARLGFLMTMPIGLRNRVAHDAPTATEWWDEAAAALKPLIEFHAHLSLLSLLLDDDHQYPSPWFVVEGDQVWAFNGLARDMAVIYVSADGESKYSEEHSHEALLSFQMLLGKSEAHEADFRGLLSKLAPEEIKGVMMGDYLVGRPVGSGGFATVHVSRQLSTGRKLAIKILHDGQPERTKERFHQEARFLSQLDHPHIVKVYGYGEETWSAPRAFSLTDEEWFQTFSKSAPVKSYIAMEWVEGGTLDDEFKKEGEERAATQQLAEWFSQSSAALSAVHATGLVHRDIKPSNLMVDDERQIKLMDFGIARQQSKDRTLQTTTGQAFGTPAYMSPEQIRAADRAAEVGPPTDIYSLSATFYELFTNRRLYDHDTVGLEMVTTRKLQGERPERPSLHTKSLPWELETIVMGGLEPDVADRYRSMDDLKRDVDHFLNDEPIEYQRPNLWRRVQLGYRRNRTVANLVATFLILAIAGTAFYIHNVNEARELAESNEDRADDEAAEAKRQEGFAKENEAEAKRQEGIAKKNEEKAQEQTKLAVQERDRTKAESRRAFRNFYFAQMNVAQRDWEQAHIGHLVERLEQTRPEHTGAEDLRGFEWYYWQRLCHSHLSTLKGHTDFVWAVSFSPDGTRLASASGDGTVKVWDAAKGHTNFVWGVSFSPDGTRLASASFDQTVKVWDAATGQEMLTLKGHTSRVTSVAFSPDGTRLASASYDKTVKVWNAATGEETLTLKGHTNEVYSVAFSPDGTRLASAGVDKTVKVWDARPWTVELRAEQRALAFLKRAWQDVLTKGALLELIQTDQTISEPVRQRALKLVETWRGPTRQPAKLKIINGTTQVASIYWLKGGQLVPYRKLAPKKS